MHDLALNQYQDWAAEFARFERLGVMPPMVYCGLKLAGEAGEVAEKLGKLYRDRGGERDGEVDQSLALELGDVLWYVAMLARELGYELEDIAYLNISKLESRKARGVIGGSGDDR